MNRAILKLAIPNIISNVTIPLLGLVDMILMGHLGSAIYIGAISLGGTIFSVLYSFFSFLRAGTTGFTAQSYGREDKIEICYSLFRSILIAILASILIISLRNPIALISLRLLQGSEEIKELAITYYHIRIWAAPANMLLYCFNGWFVGMQNTKFPMITAITINIFNIIFSAFFVLAMHLDVEGVALGTVLAQYCGLALTLTLFLIRYRNILMPLNRRTLLDLSKIKRFFHVNIDLMIRSFLLIITIAFFTNQSATLGDNILAVNMILIQFFYIFSYFTDGFAYAGEALVGRYTGASDIDNIKKVIKFLFLWGITISLPFTLIYTLFPDVIVRLISNDPTITEAVKPYHIYMIIMPLATFAAFLWDGVYIGATASRAIRNTMIISTILVFLPCWYYLMPMFGNHGLWTSFFAFMITRGISMTLMAKKNIITIKN